MSSWVEDEEVLEELSLEEEVFEELVDESVWLVTEVSLSPPLVEEIAGSSQAANTNDVAARVTSKSFFFMVLLASKNTFLL